MEKRALIVEDQTTLRDLLSELLASLNFQVEAVSTAAEARTCLAGATFQIVLLDLVLPDEHGLELLTDLRSMSGRPRVLILTAHARPSVVRDAIARGAHAVITKGAPLRELREAIDRVGGGGIFYCSETSRLL